MTDDEIAERIASHLRRRFGDHLMDNAIWLVNDYFDDGQSYRLAFIPDVRERAKARRDMKRIRRLVLAKLGVRDYSDVEKV